MAPLRPIGELTPESIRSSKCTWHKDCNLNFHHFYADDAYKSSSNNETAKELIKLHDELDTGILSGDPKHPNLLRLLASDFQAQHDRHSTTELMNIYQFMDLVCQMQKTFFIDAKLHTAEAWVDFEDVAGWPNGSFATVWQLARVEYYKEGVVRNSLLLSKWQKQNGDAETNWLCPDGSLLLMRSWQSEMFGRATNLE